MELSRNDVCSHFLHVPGSLSPSLQNFKRPRTHAHTSPGNRGGGKRKRVREGRGGESGQERDEEGDTG